VTTRLAGLALLCVLAQTATVVAQAPPGQAATPSDYILRTVITRHDQSKNRDEINTLQTQLGFWADPTYDARAIVRSLRDQALWK
jgi:hypothetical protein